MTKVNQTDGDGGGGLAGAPPANIEDPEGPGAKALLFGYKEEPLAESSANFKGRGLAKNETSPNLKTSCPILSPSPTLTKTLTLKRTTTNVSFASLLFFLSCFTAAAQGSQEPAFGLRNTAVGAPSLWLPPSPPPQSPLSPRLSPRLRPPPSPPPQLPPMPHTNVSLDATVVSNSSGATGSREHWIEFTHPLDADGTVHIDEDALRSHQRLSQCMHSLAHALSCACTLLSVFSLSLLSSTLSLTLRPLD